MVHAVNRCPFCERVWLALLEKEIPFDVVFISLYDKPHWCAFDRTGRKSCAASRAGRISMQCRPPCRVGSRCSVKPTFVCCLFDRYEDIVPTTLVPAVVIRSGGGEERVIYDSYDILKARSLRT